ncbi:MAG: MarR family transcriptional regulator [Erysipelotrichales bacterium]
MDNIEMKILIGLHRNVSDLDKITADIAKEHNLTFSQFAVLEALYSKGDLSVGEVRDLILSSMGTISLIVDNLVKLGYIERLPDKNDRRKSILHLSDEGYKVIEEVVPINKDKIINHISVLDDKEKENLLYIMKKLGGKLNE